MEWHIVTGSKGGVGKTLLSLFLLARSFDTDDSTTLVVDLNSMNTDFARSLTKWQPIVLGGNTQATFYLSPDFEAFELRKLTGLNGKCYIIMYPKNPFVGINPHYFSQFLKKLKEFSPKYSNFFGVPEIKKVIIDTNYHFCNIFDKVAANGYYDEFSQEKKGVLSQDSFFIWFMWVAAQLEALLQETTEKEVILQTVATMEALIPSSQSIDMGLTNNTPFVHIISPVSLKTNTMANNGILRGLRAWGMNIANQINSEYTIPQLDNLHGFPVGNSYGFEDWLGRLKTMWYTKRANIQDSHELFVESLIGAIGGIRPRNVLPLATIHRELTAYTDNDIHLDFTWLRNFKVYQEFQLMMSNLQ